MEKTCAIFQQFCEYFLQMNLINLRFQFVVCNLFIFRLFLDQGLNIFIQAYYNDIGKEKAFHIWWLALYLEDIGKIYIRRRKHFQTPFHFSKDWGSSSHWKFILMQSASRNSLVFKGGDFLDRSLRGQPASSQDVLNYLQTLLMIGGKLAQGEVNTVSLSVLRRQNKD